MYLNVMCTLSLSGDRMARCQTKSGLPILHSQWRTSGKRTGRMVMELPHRTLTVSIFTVGGWYNVCLVATTANNCVKEYCEKIHIEAVVADSGHREIPIMVFPN